MQLYLFLYLYIIYINVYDYINNIKTRITLRQLYLFLLQTILFIFNVSISSMDDNLDVNLQWCRFTKGIFYLNKINIILKSFLFLFLFFYYKQYYSYSMYQYHPQVII